MTNAYPQPLVSVDVVPMRYNYATHAVELILGRRIYEPAIDRLALPGVLVGHEHLDAAAMRALRVKIGLPASLVPLTRNVGVFDGDLRDERGPTISIAKIALLPPVRDDGTAVEYDVDPARHEAASLDRTGLPFDHDTIVSEAARALLLQLFVDRDTTHALLPHPFSTTEAQAVVDVLAERAATVKALAPLKAISLRPRFLDGTGWLSQIPSAPGTSGGRGRPTARWGWV